MAERPSGTVTFLFTDIEGSTQAWENDPERMAADLAIHDRILREAIESNGGFIFATGGDSFSAAFRSSTEALTAAAEAQTRLAASECSLRVRMGVHSGEAVERDGNYFGPALNRTARLMSIGHGGQVLVSTTTRELVTGGHFEFMDLGDHRLADLSTPTHVVQLLADGLQQEFPALRSVVATDNLPRLGEVFGRDSDIEKLAVLLRDHRLVTLTGAGGIGKTTLATSVASLVTDPFPDGRWLVGLTDLPPGSERTAISAAVAGVDDRFGSVEALAPRQMLLVLDNCEHVLDAVRSYLDDLLDAAPEVTVLATSRELIGVRGERVLPVAPLSVGEDSAHASAIDLFVTRATEAGVILDLDSDRDTITAICREVGGLPLAIELAAARTAVMIPSQILDRLSDRLSVLRGGRSGPGHHSTIEATIAWSYDLLDEETQKLLRFLSVFEGGFDLEQAEAVGDDRTVDRLTDLVRKSLVHRDGDRFGMLEAVRQYASARLREMGEEDGARQRHFEFFADWAHHVYHREEDDIRLTDTDRPWITKNLTNLRAAVRMGVELGEWTRAAEVAIVLWPHRLEVLYDRWDDEDWFAPLLPHLGELGTQLKMAILHGSGTISMQQADLDRGEALLQAEYEIFRRTGQLLPFYRGTPHNNLAIVASERGQWEEAERWYREAIEVMKANQSPHHTPAGNLGRLMWIVHGDSGQALEVIRDAREADHLNTPGEVACAQLDEADILVGIGEYDEAHGLINEALAVLRKHNYRLDQQVWALKLLSTIAFETGDTVLARALLSESIETATTEGLRPIWETYYALYLARVLHHLDADHTARRVLAEFRSHHDNIEPLILKWIQELEARLVPDRRAPSSSEEVPLLDSVRQALEGASR